MSDDLAAALRQGMRRVPAGVSVLTSFDESGEPFAMTVSSMTSVSDDPPSMLVCVNISSRISSVLKKGRPFAINVLGQQHVDVSVACSSGEQSEVRFKIGQWLTQKQSAPVLVDAEAVFVCEVDELLEYGTHNIVVGKLRSTDVADADLDPLIYIDGSYRQLGSIDTQP